MEKTVENDEKAKLTSLIEAVKNNSELSIIEKLIANVADINARNERGQTALMAACNWNENPKVVEVLLDAGADVRALNEDVKTAFDYAKKIRKSIRQMFIGG